MNIEELTPEYIFNKLQDYDGSRGDIDLSVGNMDIKLISKKVGRIKNLFLIERVSTDPKWDWNSIMFGCDYSTFIKLHPDHFYILNLSGVGWLVRDFKKDIKGWSERICKEIICRSYGINYQNKFLGEPITMEELWEELKLKGTK